MNFVFKMIDFVFKMMNFAVPALSQREGLVSRARLEGSFRPARAAGAGALL